jgi:hypothetical protein
VRGESERNIRATTTICTLPAEQEKDVEDAGEESQDA